MGSISAIGSGTKTDLKVGDRVVVVTTVGCTICEYCQAGRANMCYQVTKEGHSIGYYTDGGFAEYCLIPLEAVLQKVLIKIPSHVTDIEAAVCEPLSCVINGQDKLNISPRDTVVIIGCGPIGNLHALLAQSKGVRKIIMLDLLESKIHLSRKVLPNAVFINSSKTDPKSKIFKLTKGNGTSVVIVAAPDTAAQQLSVEVAAILGRVSFFAGLPKGTDGGYIPTNLVHYNELEIYGSYASNRSQFIEALKLISNRRINLKGLITHTLLLKDISKAIKLFQAGKTLKTVIRIS
ncbi:MAG TPA: alcohol dehydrogenase [Candidatus Zambryskibacteria bacterium]|nr:alcohol dehydrogenase [Candidatus Zambryskibacteria bacterium]